MTFWEPPGSFHFPNWLAQRLKKVVHSLPFRNDWIIDAKFHSYKTGGELTDGLTEISRNALVEVDYFSVGFLDIFKPVFFHKSMVLTVALKTSGI